MRLLLPGGPDHGSQSPDAVIMKGTESGPSVMSHRSQADTVIYGMQCYAELALGCHWPQHDPYGRFSGRTDMPSGRGCIVSTTLCRGDMYDTPPNEPIMR